MDAEAAIAEAQAAAKKGFGQKNNSGGVVLDASALKYVIQ